MADLRSSDFM